MNYDDLPDDSFKRCSICDRVVRPSPLALQEVTGYIKPRSAGGANHIIGKQLTGRVVCPNCAVNVQGGQESMFDA